MSLLPGTYFEIINGDPNKLFYRTGSLGFIVNQHPGPVFKTIFTRIGKYGGPRITPAHLIFSNINPNSLKLQKIALDKCKDYEYIAYMLAMYGFIYDARLSDNVEVAEFVSSMSLLDMTFRKIVQLVTNIGLRALNDIKTSHFFYRRFWASKSTHMEVLEPWNNKYNYNNIENRINELTNLRKTLTGLGSAYYAYLYA